MTTNENANSPEQWTHAILRLIIRISLIVFVIYASIFAIEKLKIILIYVVIGVILAYIMRPISGFIARKGFLVGKNWDMHRRRQYTTGYVLLLMIIFMYFSVKFMVTPFVEEVKEVTANWDIKYKPKLDAYSESTRDWYERTVKKDWRDKIATSVQKGTGNGDFEKNVTATISSVAGHVGGLAHQIVEIVLLPVLAYYFAYDSKKLKHEFVGTLPRKMRKETLRIIHEFNMIMHSYVIGQAILCALAGFVVGLLLVCLGVPYALTLGLMAGFTRAIPIVGPIIGGIPIIGFTLVTNGLPIALVVLAFFTFMHFAESKFIMPKIIGDRMDLHSVVIILVLLIGQEFGGLLGMFFAPPIAALIRVIVRRYWIRPHMGMKVKDLIKE